MPRWSLSCDPFASLLDTSNYDGPSRSPKAWPAVWILLIPMLGFAGMALGTRAKSTFCASHVAPFTDPSILLCENDSREGRLYAIDAARRHMIYWQKKSRCSGRAGALARARLLNWQGAYQRRQALYAKWFPLDAAK